MKREIISRDDRRLRQDRFASTITAAPSSSFGSFEDWCPFLKAWFATPSGKQAFVSHRRCLEACAQGIIREGELCGDHNEMEAAYMAAKIRQCIGKPTNEASKLCINLYTKDSFLYRVLNEAMRAGNHSKLETLGPCCFLMRKYDRFSQDYLGTVYRGMLLKHDEIEIYKDSISQWKTWPAFASTSKDETVAKAFAAMLDNETIEEEWSKTLFIIEISRSTYSLPRTFDIGHISQYPEEREILIPAGTSFQIISVESVPPDEHIIKVKL